MFDPNYNTNSINPVYHSVHHPFDDQYNHHDNDHHHLLSTFHSHLLDNNNELFLQDTILPYHHPSPPQPPPAATTSKGGGSKSRKTGKKDRHSKIHTAQGPRDRRMRLSVQIARKFFDLQDMLGFDKASKTIEWLFKKSKAAIKDLTVNKSSSTSLGETMEENPNNGEENECEKMEKKGGKRMIMSEKRKEARARARERTQEKLKMQKQTLEGLEMMEENPNPNPNPSRRVSLEDQMASVGIIGKFLAGSSSMADFGDEFEDAFSMEFPENGNNNDNGDYYGIISSNMEVVHSEYSNQVQAQAPNCAFMGWTFNQGY